MCEYCIGFRNKFKDYIYYCKECGGSGGSIGNCTHTILCKHVTIPNNYLQEQLKKQLLTINKFNNELQEQLKKQIYNYDKKLNYKVSLVILKVTSRLIIINS